MSTLAGGQGLEPRFFGPKPNVLPLDDPPNILLNTSILHFFELFATFPIYNRN